MTVYADVALFYSQYEWHEEIRRYHDQMMLKLHRIVRTSDAYCASCNTELQFGLLQFGLRSFQFTFDGIKILLVNADLYPQEGQLTLVPLTTVIKVFL